MSFQIIDTCNEVERRATLNGKAQGSRRDKAGHFVVKLRLVVLPRPQRQLLDALFPEGRSE